MCETEIRNMTEVLGVYLPNGVVDWISKGGTESCNFPTEEITGAQNFNFVPNAPKWGVLEQNFVFLDEHFPTKWNLWGGAIAIECIA